MVRGLRRAALALVAAATLATLVAWTGGRDEGSGPVLMPVYSTPAGGLVSEGSYRSRELRGALRFELYLPPGYGTSSLRYPVVYFLHGLPAAPYAFRNVNTVVAALEQDTRRAIVVAPQGARDGDADPEYLDWGRGRDWETAIGSELPRYVDAHYRTIAGRSGRALVGISAGGYGATLLALNHLETFSVLESWSGYFRPTNAAGTKTLNLGSRAKNRRANVHALVQKLGRRISQQPTFLGFYVGSGDDLFRDENEQLDRELTAAGVPHIFQEYPGAHEKTLWAAHAQAWLGLALGHLDPAG